MYGGSCWGRRSLLSYYGESPLHWWSYGKTYKTCHFDTAKSAVMIRTLLFLTLASVIWSSTDLMLVFGGFNSICSTNSEASFNGQLILFRLWFPVTKREAVMRVGGWGRPIGRIQYFEFPHVYISKTSKQRLWKRRKAWIRRRSLRISAGRVARRSWPEEKTCNRRWWHRTES